MSARLLLRSLTPWGWLVVGLVLVLILSVIGRGVGLNWDPFGSTARRLAAAERRADRAQADLDARRLEADAATRQARRLDDHHQQAIALGRATAIGQAQARSAHDALEPLDPDRVARLRAHDDELCRLAADICGAAETGPADGGQDGLPARPAAAEPHPG